MVTGLDVLLALAGQAAQLPLGHQVGDEDLERLVEHRRVHLGRGFGVAASERLEDDPELALDPPEALRDDAVGLLSEMDRDAGGLRHAARRLAALAGRN